MCRRAGRRHQRCATVATEAVIKRIACATRWTIDRFCHAVLHGYASPMILLASYHGDPDAEHRRAPCSSPRTFRWLPKPCYASIDATIVSMTERIKEQERC